MSLAARHKAVPGTTGTGPMGTGVGTGALVSISAQVNRRTAVPGTTGNRFPRHRELWGVSRREPPRSQSCPTSEGEGA
jgi:hypothetical protein